MAAERSNGSLNYRLRTTDPNYISAPRSDHVEKSLVPPGTKISHKPSGERKVDWYNVSTPAVASAPPKRTPNSTKRNR